MEGKAYVFFYVPEEQEKLYEKFLPGWITVFGIKACDTVNTARNAIMQDYKGGRVAIMEDDVPWFVASRHAFAPTRHGSPPSTPRLYVDEVLDLGWQWANSMGVDVWGIYPVAYSGTALKPRVGFGNLFLVGHLVAMNVPSNPPTLKLPVKEDYELTAWAIEEFGGVMRMDCIAPYSTSGKGEGGTNMYRSPFLEETCAQELLLNYPHLFKRKVSGKERQGMAQVAMQGPVAYHTVQPEDGWWPYGAKG